jgi:hypothetical protein
MGELSSPNTVPDIAACGLLPTSPALRMGTAALGPKSTRVDIAIARMVRQIMNLQLLCVNEERRWRF